jgi:hypothetical protein
MNLVFQAGWRRVFEFVFLSFLFLNSFRSLVLLLAQSWPKGERSVDWYKAGDLYNGLLLPFLDSKHDEQVKNGVVEVNEKGMTEEQYPY